MGRLRHWALGAGLALVVAAIVAGAAGASSTDPAFKAVDFATGFPNNGAVGPVGLAFDSTNHLYVMDYANGDDEYEIHAHELAVVIDGQWQTDPVSGTHNFVAVDLGRCGN